MTNLPDSTPYGFAMACTAFPAATEAAVAIFRQGGNAVDAAVAAAWALTVCEPGNSGLGGQSIVLIRAASGETVVLDGHSQAPATASVATVSAAQQRTGHRACTTPTTPAVLDLAQRQFGVLRPDQVLEPAIGLAEDGYVITTLQHKQLRWCQKQLVASSSAAPLYLHDGAPYPEGALFRQPRLASALRRLARHGVDDFYRGAIARAMHDDMQQHRGLLTAADLAEVNPVRHKPVCMAFPAFDIETVPPPAGGFLLLLGLQLIQHAQARGATDVLDWYEMLGEVTHRVFTAREQLNHRLDEIAADRLPNFIAECAADLTARPIKTAPGGEAADREEAGETTHLCTADAEGNVVALTQSLQTLYGSKAACAEFGFLYNNYLVTCPRDPHPHQLAGRCQPRSNSAPALLWPCAPLPVPLEPPNHAALCRFPKSTSTRPMLATGAAGSRRSVSAQMHTLSAVFDRGLSLAEAIALPRLHVKLSRNVWLEQSTDAAALCERLAPRYGHIEVRKHPSYAMGCVQALQQSGDGTVLAVADPRRDGRADFAVSANT